MKLVSGCLAQQSELRDLANDARETLQPEDAARVIDGIGCILGAMELDLLRHIFDAFPDLEPNGEA
ncbi:MAG: hypothetical protein ABL908_21975 [Hyphomicrobium sp.]